MQKHLILLPLIIKHKPMKKIELPIPRDATVEQVETLVEDLFDARKPSKVVHDDKTNEDTLVITIPYETSDIDLVRLGMFIQSHFDEK
jgi:hypothetical protein